MQGGQIDNAPSVVVCRALDHISVIVIGYNKIIQIPLFHSVVNVMLGLIHVKGPLTETVSVC